MHLSGQLHLSKVPKGQRRLSHGALILLMCVRDGAFCARECACVCVCVCVCDLSFVG